VIVAGGYPAENGEVPLPDWPTSTTRRLRRSASARSRRPSASPATPQQLFDERRYDVPVTVISTEFSSEMLRRWIEHGLAPVRELAKIRDVEYVDLPTGHWPQFTRPQELGRAIVESVDRG
jgi:hypothetical protein